MELVEWGTLPIIILPAAQVIIIDPNRGNRSLFHRQMALLGFTLSETMIEAPLWDGTPYRGRLLHYQRSLPPASVC